LYWLLYFCLLSLVFVLMTINHPQDRSAFFYWNEMMLGFAFVPAILVFYVHYLVLVPRLLVPRKIGLLLVFSLGVSALAAAVGLLILYAGMFHDAIWNPGTIIGMGLIVMINAWLNGALGLGLKSFITWYSDLRWRETYERQQYQMELALLKSQLSPHFLFNTINNIDVLIAQDAEKASLYLNQLSGMLRFMLYETRTADIPLEKELAYIEKYIALQRIRTRNADYIRYTVEGGAEGHRIAPMLLIPFVENAFKHGIPQKEGNVIDIKVKISTSSLVFTCRNQYGLAEETLTGEYNGLGNELIRKRLVLQYPDAHELRMNREEHWYTVQLTLPL
jgi:hypothetical protein